MGLEVGKNKNKMDGGLTTLNGLSESNTLAKLTVKVTDEHCSKKRQLKLQRNTNKALKPPGKKHCVGHGWGSVCLCASGPEEIACVSLAVRSSGHMCHGSNGAFSGKWNLPGNVCFVPNPCDQVMYPVSSFWCNSG